MAQTGLSSVAIRVHRMDAMVAFYSEAFGARFREVETFGLHSRFGEVGGMTLKMVPIREAVDFEGFPVHQLGFSVPEVERVIAAAQKHGGRQEGEILRAAGGVQAAIRDPDGNSIELYSAQ